MEKLFSDLEGLRVALEIEVRGKEFYRQAYQKSKNEAQTSLFLALMNEEVAHYEAFSRIYDILKQNRDAAADEYLFDPEVSRYLTALTEAYIFPPPEKAAAAIDELSGITAVLNLAMQAEKDSILLYDELARNAKFEAAKKVFSLLKVEEQKHVIKIREMMNAWLYESSAT
ncbi:rubrerythrin [Lucifera butyrica]|uniref:Rubrerythrin n=1 Tax=Lucifera butyrica TaxID=1351585 RepID=A0A498R4E2_9FIRM|nr:ferritin family protein [Lucifera butyrica]VBB06301.1 rubrerythrin [Lucifera butyrica]